MEFVLGLVDADDLSLAVLPRSTIKNELVLLAHRGWNRCHCRHDRRNERRRRDRAAIGELEPKWLQT